MTYNEERLAIAETQLDLAVAGFDRISQKILSKEVQDYAEHFEPYILAIKELKGTVAYLRKDVESEKAKAE